MPTLAKKLLEIENNIRRQNALKSLLADQQQQGVVFGQLDAIRPANPQQILKNKICMQRVSNE